jgi:hypothetical protein
MEKNLCAYLPVSRWVSRKHIFSFLLEITMNKRTILLLVSVLALTIVSIAWGRHRQVAASSQEPAAGEQKGTPEVPDHIVYLHLFRHIAAFKKKAVEMARAGKDGSSFGRYFKRKLELSDTQAQTLDDIASDCDQELNQLDARAKTLIDLFKAQYPGGKVPHGELPKPPPAELRAMTEERNAIVLRYRDRLHGHLGDVAFNRLQSFVQRQVAPNIYNEKRDQPAVLAQSNEH